MSFCRLHRRFAAWLAMWMMVFGALAPTMAQAMVAASDNGQWIEVCSVSGMAWLRVESSEAQAAGTDTASDQDGTMADMGQHCPWCSFHGSALGLPPSGSPAPWLASQSQAVPQSVVVAWLNEAPRCAQARAPPLVS